MGVWCGAPTADTTRRKIRSPAAALALGRKRHRRVDHRVGAQYSLSGCVAPALVSGAHLRTDAWPGRRQRARGPRLGGRRVLALRGGNLAVECGPLVIVSAFPWRLGRAQHGPSASLASVSNRRRSPALASYGSSRVDSLWTFWGARFWADASLRASARSCRTHHAATPPSVGVSPRSPLLLPSGCLLLDRKRRLGSPRIGVTQAGRHGSLHG
jgi:hypothetical protein